MGSVKMKKKKVVTQGEVDRTVEEIRKSREWSEQGVI